MGRKPQPGEKYSGHSLRKGGASAANAVGVQLPAIMAFGVWKSLAAAQLYISPLVTADLAAFRFFGWMLPRTFAEQPHRYETRHHDAIPSTSLQRVHAIAVRPK